jgi:hypothetical protein
MQLPLEASMLKTRGLKYPTWKASIANKASRRIPMRSRPTEVSWFCNSFTTPSRCPVPSKCHQFSARRKAFELAKAFLRGTAENHWQSSTWPKNLLYFGTMNYMDYANYLQEKVICFYLNFTLGDGSLFITNVKIISYCLV